MNIQTMGTLASVKAASIGDGVITAAQLGKLQTTAGGMNADLTISGNAGSVSVKGGDANGVWEAAKFGAITVTGGNLDARVDSAGAVAKIIVKGGDFTGDIRAGGALGAVSVSADKAGLGGNVSDVTISASKIAALTVKKNVTALLLLAGADLGSDYALGGIGTAADSFAAGSIGKVSIGGNVTSSVLGAGLTTTNAILKDNDDGILGGTGSAIAGLTIGGSASADSLFAAGRFKGSVKVDGAKVNPTADGRFFMG
ncbi:MAG: hypothetical protein EOP84_21675 [Verrucomicrobiaceae bacterium]|nr:MAG: hypothetical protein EOP84_21675 [Verrucomicrobiaceae bacterium]